MMDYLYKNDYKTINIGEFYRWYKGEIEYYGKTLMIAFDDGNYEDYYLAYPIIKKYNFKATSFIVGSRINKTTSLYNKNIINYIGLDIINKLRKEYPNFEFQSHTYNMHGKINETAKILLMNKKEIEKDFEMNNQFNFSSLAYPYGAYNKIIKNILNKNKNYSVAFSYGNNKYASRKCDIYSIPRIEISGEDNLKYLIKWLI